MLFEVLLACGVRYVPSDSCGRFVTVRPPDQVLMRPGHAGSLDLAVTFAAACLDMGVHPLIAVFGRDDDLAAVVIVWMRGEWDGGPAPGYPLDATVHTGIPRRIARAIRTAPNLPGEFAALDASALAAVEDGQPAGESGAPTAFEEAMARGARLLVSGAQPTAVLVDIGLAHRAEVTHSPPEGIDKDPLAPAYFDHGDESSILRDLRARYGVVPFYRRDELDILLDWCETEAAAPRPKLAVVHGAGGAGKTHLAAELAERMTAPWYAGFLIREPDPVGLRWLSSLASPLMVVVDYAEAAKPGNITDLLRALADRPHATRVLLTARSLGPWWEEVLRSTRDGERRWDVDDPIQLQRRHPNDKGVFRHAAKVFARRGGRDVPTSPETPTGSWTTLDLVMLAWLAANGSTDLPATRGALHTTVLNAEIRYWARTIQTRTGLTLGRPALEAVGACLSLLAPQPARLSDALSAVPLLRRRKKWRDALAGPLESLMPPDPEEGRITLRPDPIADHLMLQLFAGKKDLLARCLQAASADEEHNACLALTRASEHDLDTAARLAGLALAASPTLWRPAYAVASAQGGVFGPALESHADRDDTTMPLAELARMIPVEHGTLRRLALIAARRTLPDLSGTTADPEILADQAAALANLAVRQAATEQREQALEASAKAAKMFEDLTRLDSVRFTPDYAAALNTLANRQGQVGLREHARETMHRCVGIYRKLIKVDAAAFTPSLALALHNLAIRQAAMGEREEALRSATQAVKLRRRCARSGWGTPAERHPVDRDAAIASSLDSLAVRQAALGDRDGALASATEAVEIKRKAATADPGAFTPALAISLMVLSVRQAEMGQRERALAQAAEAVAITRRLWSSDAQAFAPDLAMSLENLAVRQAESGRSREGLANAAEAVSLRRALARTNPAAFVPDLATALVTLANRYNDLGQTPKALSAAQEAVTLRRRLVEENADAFLPDLAIALNNLAIQQGGLGLRGDALASANESVTIWERIAVTATHSFDSRLASALTNLINHQAAAARYQSALATARRAVTLARRLVRRNADAFRADLGMALTNLGIQLAQSGVLEEALDVSREAVSLYAALSQANPGAFNAGLAAASVNLANRESALGDRRAALAAAGQGVNLYRELAQADPAAFISDLAMSLNNLAAYQTDARASDEALVAAIEAASLWRRVIADAPADEHARSGLSMALTTLATTYADLERYEEAMAALIEAVALSRALADADPAQVASLTNSLNNLAALQAQTGLRYEALETAAEVVELRRVMAAERPEVHSAALASALASLAVHRTAVGHQEEALATATESVEIYRRWETRHPGASSADLALALVNLSSAQEASGKRREAVVTMDEAAALRHRLCRAAPDVYLSALVSCVTKQADLRARLEPPMDALAAFEDTIYDLGPAAQAEILSARARWRHTRGDNAGALDDLVRAACLADAERSPQRAGRARRAVRHAAAGPVVVRHPGDAQASANTALPEPTTPALPHWATVLMPADLVEATERWIAEAPAGRRMMLESLHQDFSSPEWLLALHALHDLNPEVEDVSELRRLLAEIDTRGLEWVLEDMAERERHTAVLSAWLATPTWTASRDFLRRHPDLAAHPATRELLEAGADDPRVARYLGIVILAAQSPLDEVYDVVLDEDIAADSALTALEVGNLETVEGLLLAAPSIARRPFVGRYIATTCAALRADDGWQDHSAERLLADAATEGDALTLTAAAARLRRLARRRPEAAATLLRLASVLDASRIEARSTSSSHAAESSISVRRQELEPRPAD
ncbi:tetratricopeptide repeat protein [Nonomuraea guangzhouensis]|uniref:tetratricopeptide repeat protein n=1 Tax=Nonomuraea guangzhouensis TaxID=1291555 RepID=UPI001C5CCE58|nr:tetratricopeptide repeat protein [Nonomuraea guangzhouensis]